MCQSCSVIGSLRLIRVMKVMFAEDKYGSGFIWPSSSCARVKHIGESVLFPDALSSVSGSMPQQRPTFPL